ncbi:MAG TPA: hypothetical protein HPQ04_03650 [Rhodospirillaceae bacterium]|nr:hypothetical protein [Rhodospirillaceae bacterium]
MTECGRFALSHFPRVHHRYRRQHGGRRWWLVLALIAGAVTLWMLPDWRP